MTDDYATNTGRVKGCMVEGVGGIEVRQGVVVGIIIRES